MIKNKHLTISLTFLTLLFLMSSCISAGRQQSGVEKRLQQEQKRQAYLEQEKQRKAQIDLGQQQPEQQQPEQQLAQVVEVRKVKEGSPYSPEPVSVNGEAINQLDLRLLLTDLYSPRRGQKKGYGYYIYLVFANNSESTRAKRQKASEAFICSFSFATDEDVQQLPKETIALFLAPVNSSRHATLMYRVRHRPDLLLRGYSYSEGQLFLNKMAGIKELGSIAILGSRTMLNPRSEEPFPDQVEVLDLSQFSPHEIKETIIGLRKVVLGKPSKNDSTTHFETLQQPRFEWRLAAFFESVGNAVISLATIQKAIAADERECI